MEELWPNGNMAGKCVSDLTREVNKKQDKHQNGRMACTKVHTSEDSSEIYTHVDPFCAHSLLERHDQF